LGEWGVELPHVWSIWDDLRHLLFPHQIQLEDTDFVMKIPAVMVRLSFRVPVSAHPGILFSDLLILCLLCHGTTSSPELWRRNIYTVLCFVFLCAQLWINIFI
jgi:hypothetical protein